MRCMVGLTILLDFEVSGFFWRFLSINFFQLMIIKLYKLLLIFIVLTDFILKVIDF